MTDELDKLKRALQDAAPAPEGAAKLAALRVAEENFEKLQDSGEFARPTKTAAPTRPGFLRGLATMFTPKSLMLTTSTIAIFAIGYVVVEPFSTPETAVSNETADLIAPVERPAPKATSKMAEASEAVAPEVKLDLSELGSPPSTTLDQSPLIAISPAPTTSQRPASKPEAPTTNEIAPIVIAPDVGAEQRLQNALQDSAREALRPDDGPSVSRRTEAQSLEQSETRLAEEAPQVEGELSESVAIAPQAPVAAPPIKTARPQPTAPQEAKRRQLAGDAGRLNSVLGSNGGAPSTGMGPNISRPIIAPEPPITEQVSNDKFANDKSNPIKVTTQSPVSTFSIDVDTTSYSWVRRSLQNGQLPSADAVRIEEMVNYFPYAYPGPEGDAPFETSVSVQQTPWNADTQLVHIGIQGERPAQDSQPPLNLVFLIDTSGSMSSADKLPLLIQSFRLMLAQLRPQDQVAIVTYAGRAGLVLEPTSAQDTAKINAALGNLAAGGSTAGAEGLNQAYAVAADMMEDQGEISRVILATDGDFNVGVSSVEGMKKLVEQKRKSGTYLSVLGFGRGNLNDALMQALAQNGNGQAAYIDTLSEARKVLVDQLGGALFPIAGDVKIQVEFNPAQIAEYRLIGYETRALAREDFNNDKVDAGDIGAGHTVTALYEVTPVGSPAIRNTPLRYQAEAEVVATSDSDELGFLRLRYKTPGEDRSQLIETPIQNDVNAIGPEVKFATAIAGFGQLLRDGTELGDWSYSDAIALALSGKGEDAFGYRSEAITLMRLAESLSDVE